MVMTHKSRIENFIDYSQVALVIGSQIAVKTGKMALVSMNMPGEIGFGASRLLMGLVRDLLDRLEEN